MTPERLTVIMRRLKSCIENGIEEFSDDGFYDAGRLMSPVFPQSWSFNMSVVGIQPEPADDKEDVEHYRLTLEAIKQSIEQFSVGVPLMEQQLMEFTQDSVSSSKMTDVFERVGLVYEDGVFHSDKYNISVKYSDKEVEND